MFSSSKRIKLGPGQESVWDYPRPPRLERVSDKLRVTFAGETVAETNQAYRVLETSHPPVYYFPPPDVRQSLLIAAAGHSFCEFKGMARYWTLDIEGARSENDAAKIDAAKDPDPTDRFRAIKDFFAFYASRVDGCWVGDERVQAQASDFYGGWITHQIIGPFKGGPGTLGW